MALANGDILARAGPFLFLVLAATSAFAIARSLGAAASGAILAVGLFVTTLQMLFLSFVANVDAIFVAGYLAATYFFVRIRPARRAAAGTPDVGGRGGLGLEGDRNGFRAPAAGRRGHRGPGPRRPAAPPDRPPAPAGPLALGDGWLLVRP